MGRVDYYAIQREIQAVLQAAAALSGVTVLVEEELLFGAETTPAVMIYLDRRDAPAALQRIRAGTSTDFTIRFSIWAWSYSLEGVTKAAELRDTLMGHIEVALMANRTLNGSVATSWLDGGEFMSANDQGAWLMGGEVVLVVQAQATT